MATAELRPRTSLEDSTSILWLSSTLDSEKILSEVPKIAGDPSRQRRSHRKSNGGCENCKKRRVKCNEETPCANCVRRGQHCRRGLGYNKPFKVPQTPPGAPPLYLGSNESEVNLQHLKLYHHFENYTIQTLLFSPEMWQYALQLSFHFDFLANAILCVSARHLSVLMPERSYSTKAAAHLGRALSQFRRTLSGDFKSTNIDAFIATSLLLQYEIWTSTDDYSSCQDRSLSLDMPRDRIFAFCSSLKKMFLNCLPLMCDQPSVFIPYIQHDSRNALTKTAEISSNTLATYQNFFSSERPLSARSFSQRIPHTRGIDLIASEQWQSSSSMTKEVVNPIDDCFKPVVTQLCLILSFLPESRPSDSIDRRSSMIPGLLKHIHSFPVICHGPFNSLIQQGNTHALLLLFHFYRAVRCLIPENECWWVHRRARVSEVALKDWLMERISEQADEKTLKHSRTHEVQR